MLASRRFAPVSAPRCTDCFVLFSTRFCASVLPPWFSSSPHARLARIGVVAHTQRAYGQIQREIDREREFIERQIGKRRHKREREREREREICLCVLEAARRNILDLLFLSILYLFESVFSWFCGFRFCISCFCLSSSFWPIQGPVFETFLELPFVDLRVWLFFFFLRDKSGLMLSTKLRSGVEWVYGFLCFCFSLCKKIRLFLWMTVWFPAFYIALLAGGRRSARSAS